nr:hypothetical protein [uncultured Sphingomonas sp.]
MRKVILVSGAAGTGKTSSIKAASGLLHINIDNPVADILLACRLKLRNRLHFVGIASDGDSDDVVRANVKFLQGCSPSYAIFACRTRGAGYRAVEAFADKNNAELFVVHTEKQASALKAYHMRIAQQIVSHIL